MMFWGRMRALWLGLFLIFTRPCEARTFTFSEVPADLDQVEIFLHTIDVGNLIFNNFGHTAVRVLDRRSGLDLVFNWGIFDFGDPIVFPFKFYRGDLRYKLGIYPYAWAIETYKYDQRTVWEDKIILSSDQKRRFLEKLVWNSRPENREYSYYYFWDNCSTRPRDYLNDAVDGQLRSRTHQQLVGDTFRDVMVRAYQYNPGMEVLLDVGLNSRLDRKMTVWEEMFLPLALRDTLLKTPIDGQVILESGKVLVEASRPPSYEGLAYTSTLVLFGIFLAVVGVVLYLQKMRPTPNPWLLRFWMGSTFPLVCFGAFVGFLMPLSWAVSQHGDLHHNANMWLFWPLDFLFLWYGSRIFITGRAVKLSHRSWNFVRTYLLVHILVSLSLPIFFMLGLVKQDVSRVIVYLLVPYLLHLFYLYRFGFKRADGEQA